MRKRIRAWLPMLLAVVVAVTGLAVAQPVFAEVSDADKSTMTVDIASRSDGTLQGRAFNLYRLGYYVQEDTVEAASSTMQTVAERALSQAKLSTHGDAVGMLYGLKGTERAQSLQYLSYALGDGTLTSADAIITEAGSAKVQPGWYFLFDNLYGGSLHQITEPNTTIAVRSGSGVSSGSAGKVRPAAFTGGIMPASVTNVSAPIQRGTKHSHNGGLSWTYDLKWKGLNAFCYQPLKTSPPSGGMFTGNTWNNMPNASLVRNILYFGYQGPADMLTAKYGKSMSVLATHYALVAALGEDVHELDNPHNAKGFDELLNRAKKGSSASVSIEVIRLVPAGYDAGVYQHIIAFDWHPWYPSIATQARGANFTANTSNTDWNNWKTGKGSALGASTGVLDHFSVTIKGANKPDDYALYRAELKYDSNGDGKAERTSRHDQTVRHTRASGKSLPMDSKLFTPADLGMGATWQPGRYWFETTIGCVSGGPCYLKPNANGERKYVHDGSRDPKERWVVAIGKPKISTSVSGKTASNGKPVKDNVTVTLGTGMAASDLTARGTLYWSRSAGQSGQTIPQDARKVADLEPLQFKKADFSNGKATKTFTPPANLSDLGTGYYTYVWRLDQQDLPNGMTTVSDGWQPNREQTVMETPWELEITKQARQPGAEGAWLDRAASGAVLHLKEVTDRTGSAFVDGAVERSVTLNLLGKGTFTGMKLKAGETKYYRLWESRVALPLNVPKDGAYWIVSASNIAGTRGVAKVSVSGSSEETRLLIKGEATGTSDGSTSVGSDMSNQPITWHQAIGDTMQANIVPPITGSRQNIVQNMLLAGSLGLLVIALTGCAVLLHHRGKRYDVDETIESDNTIQ